MNEVVLSVKNLAIALTHNPSEIILNNVSFDLFKGSVYALVGESGSGKSVTAQAMMRLLPYSLKITSGQVLFHGKDIFQITEADMGSIRGGRVAMIFQDASASLNPVRSIGSQIMESLIKHTDIRGIALYQRATELLEEVEMPDAKKRLSWYPYQISGGQQQRVMIAIALACNPEVLLADEPTTALDVTVQKHILSLLQRLVVRRHLTVLFITHDLHVVLQMADYVGVMYKGEIIEEAACKKFFENPQMSYSKKLLASVVRKHGFRRRGDNGTLLRVMNLKTYFAIRKGIFQRVHSYLKAVNDVSFSISKGETFVIVGESGSGKTTVGRSILQLEKITAGSIWYDDQRIDNLSRKGMLEYRKKIQVIFQDPFGSMNPRMSVGDIIEEGMISLNPSLSKYDRKIRIIEFLKKVYLEPDCRFKYPHEFSGGQRQRIAIARALAVEPELIICDEPTSSLDVSIRADIVNLLLELQGAFGVSYLLITHDLLLVPQIAHQIAIMKDGKIVEQGDAKSILLNPSCEYTKELLSSTPELIT